MSNASNYADGIHADILARVAAGAPFGWINRETDEWEGDEPPNRPIATAGEVKPRSVQTGVSVLSHNALSLVVVTA